ncbi:synaptosomal-associated protein 29 [Carcharodon carcharias]|uniref:synaptosomal-associated protein 29 n=1 Tax=Carcharodon carcharias TaxID=13397 RepID=UPI001B7F5A37|nr:synaptosomal-associated protein 29 [Carcharodon carcharias]
MSVYPNRYNPFAEEDEEETAAVSGGRRSDPWREEQEEDGPGGAAQDRQWSLRQQVLRSADRTVQSSGRCLTLVYESEQMGTEAATELMRQGESLRRSENMVDKMDQDLKVSQKHINSIKSIFGGITNYFKSKNPEPQASPVPEKQANSKLQDALDKSMQQGNEDRAMHPNLRRLDTSGFGASGSSAAVENNSYSKNNVLRTYHAQIDNNLDELSSGLGRLKGLAIGLQTEIDDQDQIIDRLTAKTERLDSKIVATDRQIRKL